MRLTCPGAIAACCLFAGGYAEAADIYIVRDPSDPSYVTSGVANWLTELGHTVTASTATLTDYRAYDQVWDMRYTYGFNPADLSAYDAYLESGGAMFVVSDHNTFYSRYSAIPHFVQTVGGGAVTLSGTTTGSGVTQAFTSQGQALNSPNGLDDLLFYAGGVFSNVTQGFLVTENGDTGTGTVWAWDRGDLTGAASARMVVSMDLNVFNGQNGIDWVENLATYLGGAGEVPEPGIAGFMLLGAGALACRRSRQA